MAEFEKLVQKRYVGPLTELVLRLKSTDINKKISSVFLYGSVAKKEAKETSDIDIMIILDYNQKLTNPDNNLLEEIRDRIYEKYKIKIHFEHEIFPLISVQGTKRWKKHDWLIREVFKEGILVYSNTILATPSKFFGLKEYDLFVYDLTPISKSKAVTLSRKLNGFIQKKIVNGKVKEYSNKGIIETVGGKKLGKGTMLIPKDSSPLIVKFFEEFEVVPKITTVFLIEE